MEVWLLLFWSATATPFEGGQYSEFLRCYEAGAKMYWHFRKDYGPRLRWKCELTRL